MKALSATLLATALSASFSVHAAGNPSDPASYKNMSQKAAADYKAASANCTGMGGAARQVCVEEAKVARARAEADAVAQYKNTQKDRTKARTALANADHALAKAKCAAMTGGEKDSCLSTAHTVHTAALDDAKADRNMAVASTNPASPVTSTETRDPAKAAAVDKCAQIAGQPTTGCLIQHEGKTIADRTERATERTAITADSAAQRTDNAAERAGDKTERMAENAAAKTERAGDTIAAKTKNVAAETKENVADAVITTKIKADLFAEPELKALAIDVDTENGVVNLSGFVASKAEADKAVRLAKGVKGVTNVKNSLKVK
ncbi:BON domain-containing protein [Massilia sp. RP-1-19]|uniref:Osmotically-inducible protein Y n=1 Tax=Massilia polaris TaxID=2728846 RepID=A0A848HJU8_9BURK|nr:BON domain-containing protein [Massilia polaris]NML61307.1 BON domain-containing protein [Massilia polaris]